MKTWTSLLSVFGLIVLGSCFNAHLERKAMLRQKHEDCINQAQDALDAQKTLLEYQIDNQYLIYNDYNLSWAYIDFLKEKADNACEGAK